MFFTAEDAKGAEEDRQDRLAADFADEREINRWGKILLTHRNAFRDLAMRYSVVYEKSETGWAAYAPDLPGLGVAGASLEEVKQLIREGIDFHLEGIKMREPQIPKELRTKN